MIGKEKAKQARAEISGRLLRACRQSSSWGFLLGWARLNATVALAILSAVIANAALAEPGERSTGSAEASSAAPQGEMIRGMVERLAARLKENAADLDGWLMLIRSYSVLKEPVKMEETVASARKQFASEPEALDKIASLVRQLGQAAPAEGVAQAPGMTPQDLPTVESMVERLAARLKRSGGDLDSWLMLIRSYAVLKDTAKAQETAAAARKQFASEPPALDAIEALSRKLELPPEEGKGQPTER
jgi:cytochrome c-type biogenesis protein CcmH/NrfG